MMSIKSKSRAMRKMQRQIVRALSPFPFARRRVSAVPFILGGIGVAAIGAIASIFIFSPRTRQRALLLAKDAYGKVTETVGQRIDLGRDEHLSNSVGEHGTSGYARAGM